MSSEQVEPAESNSETPPTGDSDAGVVVLGSPELTAGIPGDGPLTIEQIEAWLNNPANHQTLKFRLPLGLAGAEPQIQGLEQNPLTRAKIELGRQLYFDRRLSADGTVSCADCHHPDEGYTRHTRFGVGIGGQTGNRNSPVSYNRILSGAQFWDGRAASLEDQALGPIANPIEMGNTHAQAVKTVQEIPGYQMQFARIFEDGVTIENIAAAIATFERVLVTGPSPYDYHARLKPFANYTAEDFQEDPELAADYQARLAAAKEHPLSESARRGEALFFSERVGCSNCHAGANFTDEKYHNLGVGMEAPDPDLGRYEVTKDDKDRGAFKTPTLRNVELSAPYMHDGSQETLEDVVEWYNKGGHPNEHLSDKIKKLNLTDQEKQDLVAFMRGLTGKFPPVETGRLPE